MKLAYIKEYVDGNGKKQFKLLECSCTRKITSKSDRLYSKLFLALDFEEVMDDTNMLMKNNDLMLMRTPIFIDKESVQLLDRMKKWVDWANSVDESIYNPFYREVI